MAGRECIVVQSWILLIKSTLSSLTTYFMTLSLPLPSYEATHRKTAAGLHLDGLGEKPNLQLVSQAILRSLIS